MIMPKVTTNEEEILCRHNTVKKLRALKLLYDIHNADPNRNDYDYGLINGLVLAISILTEQPPVYAYKQGHTTEFVGTFTKAPDTTAGEPE